MFNCYLIISILDEKSFQTFAIYCGLALHHAKVGRAHVIKGLKLRVSIVV